MVLSTNELFSIQVTKGFALEVSGYHIRQSFRYGGFQSKVAYYYKHVFVNHKSRKRQFISALSFQAIFVHENKICEVIS